MSKKKCGLLGRTLKHSYSPRIHERLNEFIPPELRYSYDLIELDPEEIGSFLKNSDFHALNVTIPYKQTVIPFCEELSVTAERIGSVNTITRRADGKLAGDNTDYYGFEYMLSKAAIDVKNKKVLILGSGGSSLTANAVVSDRGAGEIIVISRSGVNNYGNISNHSDADVIVNTTPVGMYPAAGESPVNLDMFPNLSGVADIIYNPSKTRLLLDAERKNIPYVNGLSMLVSQAHAAAEKFMNIKIESLAIDEITRGLEFDMKNIILTGMPGSGKTSVGTVLAGLLNRDFIDTDEMIVKSAGKTIPEIFADDGEDIFRKYETEAIMEAGKLSSRVIATGGGIVTRSANIDLIRQNSVVFFLNRDVGSLATDGRPLSRNIDALIKLYNERLPLYRALCDFEIDGNDSIDEVIDRVRRGVQTYFE